MKTQTIEVEGLSNDVRITKIRYVSHHGVGAVNWVVETEKIQPRRIVLEETEEIDKDIEAVQHFNFGNTIININSPKIWREVKETDEEPKLSLNKKDMLELIEHIKLGGQLNPNIAEFIKDK